MKGEGVRIEIDFSNLEGVEIDTREVCGVEEYVMVVPLAINGIYILPNRRFVMNALALPNIREKIKDVTMWFYLLLNKEQRARRKRFSLPMRVIVGKTKGSNAVFSRENATFAGLDRVLNLDNNN